MTRRTTAYQSASVEQALRQIEVQMVALQRRYEGLAERLEALRRAERLVKAEGLPLNGALTWTGVCLLKRWATNGNAHRAVKRNNARLHVLLHQAALGEECALDHTTYALL